MPLTLTLTEGVLPRGREKIAFLRLSESLLKWTGLTGNKFMTAAVVGSIHILPEEQTYSGLQSGPVVFVEWKVPSIALSDRAVQLGYIAEATEIVHELSEGRQPRERIWVNVVHAVDGAWGINGNAMTNQQLEMAIAQG